MTKLLLVLVIALSSLQVFATEVKLYESRETGYNGYSFSSGSYGINKDLGRAWVSLSFASNDAEGIGYDERAQVKGMSFDKTTKEIIVETETGRVVCAYEKKFLGIKSLKETGACSFKKTSKIVKRDNGYEIEEYQVNTVYFVY